MEMTTKTLRETITWRKAEGVDTIQDEPEADCAKYLGYIQLGASHGLQPPMSSMKLVPAGEVEGESVWYLDLGPACAMPLKEKDVKGFLRFHIACLEHIVDVLNSTEDESALGLTLIIDVGNASWASVLDPVRSKALKLAIDICNRHYKV